jgi:hypothetical protein
MPLAAPSFLRSSNSSNRCVAMVGWSLCAISDQSAAQQNRPIRSARQRSKQAWRHFDAERPRRLKVDDELEFGRLDNR